MKAAVLGAAGAMAAVCNQRFAGIGSGYWNTAADLRPISHSDSRVRAAGVMWTTLKALRRFEGHDVVLNCVNYYFNVAVMKSALLARVQYIDLGGLYHGTMKQYELHEPFRKAGVTALLGMGSTPGITNLMAGALAQQMDEVKNFMCASRVRMNRHQVRCRFHIRWHNSILDEFALQPMVFRNGKAEAVAQWVDLKS